jgi:hypothetical protein
MADQPGNPVPPAPVPAPAPTPAPTPARRSGVDVRAGEIRTGAGLEESRYNLEFIEFLRKWGPWVLIVLAGALLAWRFYGDYRKGQQADLAKAWAELDAALAPMRSAQDGSPDVLLRVASDHPTKGAVPLLARLGAADQWVLSASKGLLPGAQVDMATGAVKSADDILSTEKRDELLAKAKEQYQSVADASKGDPARTEFELRALFGLASVAETLGNWDQAKGHYEAAKALANARQFGIIEKLATERLADLEKLRSMPPLLPAEKVVSFNKPEPAPAPIAPLKLDPVAPSLTTPSTGPSTGTPGTPSAPITITPPPMTIPVTPATPATPAPPAEQPKPEPAPQPAPKP